MRAIAPAYGASAGSLHTGMFRPWRNAFLTERAFPLLVVGPVLALALVLLARRCRSLSLLRSSGDFAAFDISEFNIFDLVEGSTNRGAVCGTVAVDFSQCVVAANFGAAKQALNALECF
jgi:hypothetical protein